jgi:hypothetical protein
MTSQELRKAARQQYKTRISARGVFAVRCVSTGHVWVGASPNLEAARNQIWFMLRHGLHRDQPLQGEWNVCGETTFQFEILETLEPDVAALLLRDLLNNRKNHWAMELGASTLA